MNDIGGDEAWIIKRPILLALVRKAQGISPYIYATLGVILILCWGYRKLGDPWVIEKIQYILNQYQSQVFGKNGNPQDHDRITIFKYKKYCVLKSHWSKKKWYRPNQPHHFIGSFLVPYLRSGHLSQQTRICFFAPDDSDRSEGIASLAWSKQQAVVQKELPCISKTSSEQNKQKYAKRTKSPLDMINCYIEQEKPLPRSLAAVPLERNNKPWGVLVLDSRTPEGVTEEAINGYSLTIALIGQLLERS